MLRISTLSSASARTSHRTLSQLLCFDSQTFLRTQLVRHTEHSLPQLSSLDCQLFLLPQLVRHRRPNTVSTGRTSGTNVRKLPVIFARF